MRELNPFRGSSLKVCTVKQSKIRTYNTVMNVQITKLIHL